MQSPELCSAIYQALKGRQTAPGLAPFQGLKRCGDTVPVIASPANVRSASGAKLVEIGTSGKVDCDLRRKRAARVNKRDSTPPAKRVIICLMQKAMRRIQVAIFITLMMAGAAAAADWERSVALYNKGEYRAALAEFQDLVHEQPDAAGAWYYVGLCQFKLKRYERVETPLARAIDLL
jgi:tetratricopeptide (TPR) repeat protein